MKPRNNRPPIGPPPPLEIPADPLPAEPEFDDDSPLELRGDAFDVLLADDDYEPLPEFGDFWPDQDAA
jgi:hypothetical protein